MQEVSGSSSSCCSSVGPLAKEGPAFRHQAGDPQLSQSPMETSCSEWQGPAFPDANKKKKAKRTSSLCGELTISSKPTMQFKGVPRGPCGLFSGRRL